MVEVILFGVWMLLGRVFPIPWVGVVLFFLVGRLKPNKLMMLLFLMGYIDDLGRGRPLGVSGMMYCLGAVILIVLAKNFREHYPLLSFVVSLLISILLMWWWHQAMTLLDLILFLGCYIVFYFVSKIRSLANPLIYVRQ